MNIVVYCGSSFKEYLQSEHTGVEHIVSDERKPL